MADSVISYEDLIGKDDTFDQIFANIDKLKKELADLATQAQKDLDIVNPNDEKAIQAATQSVNELIKAKKALDVEEKKAAKAKKKLNDLTDEELIQREKQKLADRERVQIAKQTAILRSRESGQIEKLRAQLSLTTIQWKKLSKEELKNSAEGKKLVKQKLRLTNQLKKLEKQTGDTRRNVGNYTKSLGKLGKAAAAVFLGRSLVDGLRRIGTGIANIIEKTKDFSPAIASVSTSFSGVKDSFTSAGALLLESFAPVLVKIGNLLAKLPAFFAGVAAGATQFAKNVGGKLQIFGKQAEIVFQKIQFANPFSDKSNEEISANIKKLREEIAAINDDQGSVTQAFNEAFDATIEAQKKFQQRQKDFEASQKRAEKRKAAALERQNKLLQLQAKLQQSIQQRIDAIVSVQDQIAKLRANAIKNEEERLLRLEELRDKAVREQQEKQFSAYIDLLEKQEEALIKVYGENSKEVLEFREEANKELLEAEKRQQELSELLLEEHEKKKLQIKKDYQAKLDAQLEAAIKEELDLYDDFYEEQEEKELKAASDRIKNKIGLLTEEQKKERDFQRALADARINNIKDTNKKELELAKEQFKRKREDIEANEEFTLDQRKQLLAELDKEEKAFYEDKSKERQKKLLEDITDTANKVGEAIVEIFNKQAEQASQLVEDQAAAVETQRQRAEQGLSNTLAFEQEQLAQREAERIRAEKAAKQTAEILALFNLVSAYAASGDTNALAKGLVDWGILKALESGFEEGGYTGDNGKKQIAGVVHGQEYVVTAEDTKRFGLVGKSGADFGEAMSDYFYSPLQQNLYPEQTDRFKKNVQNQNNQVSRLENEVREMRRAFERMPKNDFDMVQLTDHFVEISKRVTQNRMSKISKHKKRL
jgi:hypothetical protein